MAVDWNRARDFLRRRIAIQSRGWNAEAIEDLTQEALIRMCRFERENSIDNLEAFMTTLAARVVIDEIRKRVTWRFITSSEEPGTDSPAPPPEGWGDVCERMIKAVLAFFEQTPDTCLDIARLYLEGHDHKEIAQRLSGSYDGIRKAWSRCLQRLRASVEARSGLFYDWAVSDEVIPS